LMAVLKAIKKVYTGVSDNLHTKHNKILGR